MWLVLLWVAVAALAATAATTLRVTRDGDDGGDQGSHANRVLVAGVGALAVLLAVLATLGGWGMGWHGTHLGHMTSSGTSTSAPPLPGAATVAVDAGDLWFAPATPSIPADTPVNLEVTNVGAVGHDLTIPDLGVVLTVEPGTTATAGIPSVPAGAYPFRCTVAGHATAGMEGTLRVG